MWQRGQKEHSAGRHHDGEQLPALLSRLAQANGPHTISTAHGSCTPSAQCLSVPFGDGLPILTCLPSLLHTPLTVLVGAMVTTGGVLGTLCPPGGTMMGPMGPRLGVLAGELWLVAGEETGDDSLLIEEPGKQTQQERGSC